MTEVMLIVVIAIVSFTLGWLALHSEPLFGWALVGIYATMLLIGGIVLLKGDKS